MDKIYKSSMAAYDAALSAGLAESDYRVTWDIDETVVRDGSDLDLEFRVVILEGEDAEHVCNLKKTDDEA